MSIRIWENRATQKKQDQRERILNAFKQRKVADKWGLVKAEKLFQPITKLLWKPGEKEAKPGVENPIPDYELDDRILDFMNELPFNQAFDEEKKEEDPYENLEPFTEEEMQVPATEKKIDSYEGFKEWLKQHGYESDEESGLKSVRSKWSIEGPSIDQDIIPLPEKSSPGPEEVKPFPDPAPEELGAEVPPGEKSQSAPSYSEATKDDPPPKYKEPRDDDSKALSTLNRFIKNSEGKPGAVIETKKSPFLGYAVEQAKYKVYEIYTERAKKVLETGDRKTAIGQKEIGPYEGKSKEEMQAMIDKFKQGQTKTGSGFNTLINRLSLGLSSIVAGNTSAKVRKEIKAIAKILHAQKVISKEQKKLSFIFKMSLSLLLDSQIAKIQNPNAVSHDFRIRFNPPIELSRNKNWKASLNKIVSMAYSWYNVRAVYGNNTLKWKKKTESAWKTVTLPDGMYSYDDINSFMQKQLGKKDPADNKSAELFTLFFEYSILRSVIVLDSTIELDFSTGTFADLLGFEKKVISAETNISKFVPNITSGVDWIFIHCDLITRDVRNVGSDVLFSISTLTHNVSEIISEQPLRLEWFSVNKNVIQEIRVYVTDGRNNIVDLNGQDMAISIFVDDDGKL